MTELHGDWEAVVDETSPNEIIAQLFHDAHKKDEFEFCCAILRVRGIETPGWNPFHESQDLISQFLGLIPLVEGKLKVRLTLFLYCHMTEMSDYYSIPANMLRIINGDRYSLSPFSKESKPPGTNAKYPGGKAKQLIDDATKLELPRLANLYDELLVKEVRNSFYHSDYFLTDDSFIIREGKGVKRGFETKNRIPYNWLLPRLSLGINTGLAILDLIPEYRESYTENKIVKGRFSPDEEFVDIELIASDSQQLTGFRSVPE